MKILFFYEWKADFRTGISSYIIINKRESQRRIRQVFGKHDILLPQGVLKQVLNRKCTNVSWTLFCDKFVYARHRQQSKIRNGTVSNIRFMLSDMLDKAVLSEYIRKNPCIGVEMPKEVKKERRVLTKEEQEKFFTFASSYIHINVLKFVVTTGCRIGEVLGLKWEDCDFEKREIIINKTIHYSKASSPVEGSKFFYTTAKTISSNRVIPMTDEVYEILQNQKIKQTEQKMWKRSIWKQHKEFQNLVFTCSDGSPVYYYNVNSAIKDYVAKINVIEIELAKEEKESRRYLNCLPVTLCDIHTLQGVMKME